MSKIKIMTDSPADVPKSLQKELGITVLPMLIIDGEKEYLDGVDIEAKAFYEILKTCDKLPSTSRPAPGSFTAEYEKAWKEGYSDLIYVCVNSNGSSTYQGAILELEDFYEDNPEAKDAINIHIIDSLTYSMGYGYAAVLGARAINEGRSTDEVISIIKDWIDHCRILFVPLDLKCVKKSGRVSAAAAFVGDALGLKPVITFEGGESKTVGKIRGDKKVASELVSMVLSSREPNTPYILAKGCDNNVYPELLAKATDALGEAPTVEFDIGSIISINSGPNVVGIIYKQKD